MSPLFHLYRVLPAVSSPPLPFLPVCSPKRAGQLNNWLLMSELSPVITAVPPYASEWCTSYKHLVQLTVFCSWITILSCHCCDLYRIQTGVPTPKISAVLGWPMGIHSVDLRHLPHCAAHYQNANGSAWVRAVHLVETLDLTVVFHSPFIVDDSVFYQMESVLFQSNRNLVSVHYAHSIRNLMDVSRATRLSITMTVVRILPPGRSRLISKFGCGGFVLMWLIVIIQKIFICGIPVPAIPTCSPRATPILAITSTWTLCTNTFLSSLPSTSSQLHRHSLAGLMASVHSSPNEI